MDNALTIVKKIVEICEGIFWISITIFFIALLTVVLIGCSGLSLSTALDALDKYNKHYPKTSQVTTDSSTAPRGGEYIHSKRNIFWIENESSLTMHGPRLKVGDKVGWITEECGAVISKVIRVENKYIGDIDDHYIAVLESGLRLEITRRL